MIDLNKNSFCISIHQEKYEFLKKTFTNNNIKPPLFHPSISFNDHRLAVAIGHIGAIMRAIQNKLPYCIIFEDDAYPCTQIINKFNDVINDVGEDKWDILNLGISGEHNGWHNCKVDSCNLSYDELLKIENIKNYSKTCYIIPYGIHGSHVYIIKECMYNKFINLLVNGCSADGALDQNHYKDNLILVVKNPLFLQNNLPFNKQCIYPKYYDHEFGIGPMVYTNKLPKGF